MYMSYPREPNIFLLYQFHNTIILYDFDMVVAHSIPYFNHPTLYYMEYYI